MHISHADGSPLFSQYKYRVAYSKLEDVKKPAEIVHPAIRAVLSAYESDQGMELHSDADLPARFGLGTSSTFLVGLLNAIEGLHGKRVSPFWLAKEAIRYEQAVLAEHVGSQDQVAAAYGGLNIIRFRTNEDIVVEPVILPKSRKEELERHLMLFFTGFSRDASKIAKTKIENMENRAHELKAMGNMVDEALDILTAEIDIRQFGELLHQTWTYKRRLSQSVTNDQIYRIYATARQAGA
jgi:D-glycero-alpha-D-manno-heptose-7-phosphate kinase